MTRLAPPQQDPAAWQTVPDPVEHAFTIAMPRGWRNRAWLERRGAAAHNLAVAVSGDGATVLFVGDATLPMLVDPSTLAFGMGPLGAVPRPFTSVEHFLPRYAHDRFARLPGFRVLGMAPSPELFQISYDKVARSGALQAYVTAGRLAFELEGDAGPNRGLLLGSCIGLGGVWWPEVLGVTTTTGDPDALAPALLGMYATRRATPEMQQRQMQERAANAARHEATMASLHANAAVLRAGHQSSMATLAAMADGHQRHMAALHAASDAADAAWARRHAEPSASRDEPGDAQRRFLNMIAEERTVVDGAGDTHQVRDGYDRYFRHRSDGTVIGTRNHADLTGMPGIDPTAFEELTIKV